MTAALKATPLQLMAALQAAREELGVIEKTGTNQFHGYDFVQAEHLFSIVRPILHKNGIWIFEDIDMTTPPFVDTFGNTHITFLFWICHTSGERLDLPIRVFASGCDRDSKGAWGDKGAYKANTGAYKYLLLRLFLFDSGEHEAEAESRPAGLERKRDAGGAGAPSSARHAEGKAATPEGPAPAQPPKEAERPPLVPKPRSAKATKEDVKKSGFYKACFRKAEELYGDAGADGGDRHFSVANDVLAQFQVDKPTDLSLVDLMAATAAAKAFTGAPMGTHPADSAGDDEAVI